MTHLFFRFLLNVFLVWLLATQFPQYIVVAGGPQGFLIVGVLLTALNVLARPVLDLIAFPLKLLLSLIAILAVNVVFLWILVLLARLIDPALLQIHGITGWILVALFLGAGNWIIKVLLRD